MAVHDIIPSTNVSMADIRDTLNANGGNVTNVLGTFFKDAAKINKWAKYKPVSYKGDFPTEGKQWRGDGSSSVWGMRVNIANAVSASGGYSVYQTPSINYSHLLPSGGSSSPYRLHDFRGYYPKAKPIYIQPLDKGTTLEIYHDTTATKTEKFYFSAFCGSNNFEVKFSNIEDVVKYNDNYHLRLVISVYKKGTDTLLGEYFNDGIPLWYSSSQAINENYDLPTCKMASIEFQKSKYWGNGISEIDIYLSLQDITYSGGRYEANKVIALPFSDTNYFKETIRFHTAYRYIRATKLLDDSKSQDAHHRVWVDITQSNAIRLYDTAGTPDLMFEISKSSTALQFKNGVTFFRSKYRRRSDNELIVRSGTLTSETGYNIPPFVDVLTGSSSQIVNVYFHFGNMFQEPSHTEGYYPAGQYTAEIYLVQVASDGTSTEQMVTTVTIYTK